MQDQKDSHLADALRVIMYVKRELGKGILLSSDFETGLIGYCDSGCASCIESRKSVTVFCVLL